MRRSMQFYCLNMFRASSGVQCSEDVATSSEHHTLLEAQRSTTQVAFQLWPPKSGSYLLIVLLIMGILMPEIC
jgi:hypothetical protein